VSDQQPIKVLHFSSRYEECGVAKYLGHYVKGMEHVSGIQNEYFDVSPYETPHMSDADLDKMTDRLREELRNYDVLHVQHEFALYARNSFQKIVEAGKRSGKKVVVTVHISPSMHGGSVRPRLRGLGPRSLVHYLRQMRNHRYFLNTQVLPFRMADLVLVHNEPTIESLKQLGVAPERIRKIIHPVQVYDMPPKSDLLTKKLHKQDGDIIYCAIGFLHRYKGLFDAVRALKFLPSNYKLAILGGMKEDSDDVELYNKLCNLIDTLGLQERVYITGYVKGDDMLNALIRECDVCIYPYDRVYYSNVSSGSLNLSFANERPLIAYPTATFKEMAEISNGAVVLCETFAYYELAREIGRIDLEKQTTLSKAYAQHMAWPKMSEELAKLYTQLVTTGNVQ
jgi:glycosyltransferase involved in cell wall biosynthesis